MLASSSAVHRHDKLCSNHDKLYSNRVSEVVSRSRHTRLIVLLFSNALRVTRGNSSEAHLKKKSKHVRFHRICPTYCGVRGTFRLHLANTKEMFRQRAGVSTELSKPSDQTLSSIHHQFLEGGRRKRRKGKAREGSSRLVDAPDLPPPPRDVRVGVKRLDEVVLGALDTDHGDVYLG